MSEINYLISVLLLSAIGIILSWINSKIVVCPRNMKQSRLLELGFITLFLIAVSSIIFNITPFFIRGGMLFMLVMSVIYTANKTLDHFLYHEKRKRHFCRITEYKKTLGEIIKNGRNTKQPR